MGKSRIEAFSDGVFAILITIMVLELRVPEGETLDSLRPLWGVFLSYTLSFVFLGIYWNGHHHVLLAARRVSAGVMWTNLHLLFWLSLVPFVTGWMGATHFAAQPTAAYGMVMLAAAVAYNLLQRAIIRADGAASLLREAIAADWKGRASLGLYALAVLIAWRFPVVAGVVYVAVAVMWLVPDRRIARVMEARVTSG